MSDKKFNSVGSVLLTVVNRDAAKLRNCKIPTNTEGLTDNFMYLHRIKNTDSCIVTVVSKTMPHPAISMKPEYAIVDVFKGSIEPAIEHYDIYKEMLEDEAKKRLGLNPE